MPHNQNNPPLFAPEELRRLAFQKYLVRKSGRPDHHGVRYHASKVAAITQQEQHKEHMDEDYYGNFYGDK